MLNLLYFLIGVSVFHRYMCRGFCGDDQVLHYIYSQRGRNHNVLVNTGRVEYCSHVSKSVNRCGNNLPKRVYISQHSKKTARLGWHWRSRCPVPSTVSPHLFFSSCSSCSLSSRAYNASRIPVQIRPHIIYTRTWINTTT